MGFNLEASDAVETHAKRLGVTIMTYKVWGAKSHMGPHSFPTPGACRLHHVTLNPPPGPEQHLTAMQL